MSTLTLPFPTSVQVAGIDIEIDSDFRTILHCMELQGDELRKENLLEMLQLFYKKKNFFTEEHVQKMFWFFSCGREKEKRKFPRKVAGVNGKQSFDFEKDADLIYAGFLQQYGIDLQETKMHWWKFMILLESLGSNTKLYKIMEYRTIDITNKNLGKEEREFYKAMQRYYGLDSVQVLDSKSKLIEEALMNGGNVSDLL